MCLSSSLVATALCTLVLCCTPSNAINSLFPATPYDTTLDLTALEATSGTIEPYVGRTTATVNNNVFVLGFSTINGGGLVFPGISGTTTVSSLQLCLK